MNDFCGHKVKIFLVNSLSAEGIIESWDSNKVVLISNNKKLFINSPEKNIIMYYILDATEYQNEASKKIKEILNEEESSKRIKEIVTKEEEEINSSNSLTDLSLRFKKIAELKVMAAESQREQIRKELTTFHSVNTDQILGKYGTPSFIKPQHDSSEKTNDGNAIDIRILSEMSGKAIK